MGLTEVAGYYTSLLGGFNDIEIKACFVDLGQNLYKYKNRSNNNSFIHFAQYCYHKKNLNSNSNILLKFWYELWCKFSSILLFLWAITKFNTFIFCSNSTFFYYLELPVLKALKKKIIHIYHGTDSRPPYINYFLTEYIKISINQLIKQTKKKKEIVNKIEKHADIVIDNIPQSHFHTRPFINWLMIGVPFDPVKLPKKQIKASSNNTIRILHAPSNPIAKGTPIIRNTIEEIQNKGYAVSYTEIVEKSNAEVLKELSNCDFVIDELYSDAPLAGFSTEAAFFGKPAIIGSYYIDELRKNVPKQYIPPSCLCHPDNLSEAVENMLSNKKYRENLGKQAQEFVKKNWTATEVAKRLITLISGNIPSEWYFNPKNLRYIYGAGLRKERTREIIKDVISFGGINALQVNDKPELENLFVTFANSELV